jgi:hypothetical protein
MQDREPVGLSIHHIPVSVTFGLFDDGYSLVSYVTLTLSKKIRGCGSDHQGGTYHGRACDVHIQSIPRAVLGAEGWGHTAASLEDQ